jgi:hypothetical protein
MLEVEKVPGVIGGCCIGVQLSLLNMFSKNSMFSKNINVTNLIASYYGSQSLHCNMKSPTCLGSPMRHGCLLNTIDNPKDL